MQKDKKEQRNTTKKETFTAVDILLYVGKNLLAVVIVWFMLKALIRENQGYDLVCNQMLKSNMEKIHQFPNLTTDQKWEQRLGLSYVYLRFIKENTPENAVVLYPEKEAFFPKNIKSKFQQEPQNKIWATRFLYPRKLVLRREGDKNKYHNKVTHVAIVHGIGYEDLSYPVDSINRYPFAILPKYQVK